MLRLNDINKKLGRFSLSGINLSISEGEYYVILGRSGAGKTQLLELIAGLVPPDTGTIILDGEDITAKKLQNRSIGIVFQDYAIFPHLTVYGNIAYPLKARKMDERTISEMVTSISQQMNIVHLLGRSTVNLSGGERQRIAFARTLVTMPRVLLLDEPLASLDASLRDDVKKMLRKLNRDGQTIIHVTHDYNDAISLARRVGVIHNGRIIQEGTVDEVFSRPVNRFVARYAGIRNFFRMRIEQVNGSTVGITPAGLIINLPEKPATEDCLAVLRGSDIRISLEKSPDQRLNSVRCKVEEVINTVNGIELTLNAGDLFYTSMRREEFEATGLKERDEAWTVFSPESLIILTGHSE